MIASNNLLKDHCEQLRPEIFESFYTALSVAVEDKQL
jgi:hypothetical protein